MCLYKGTDLSRAGYQSKFVPVFTLIPVPERYFFRYLFYNINSNKKEITLDITVQIFSFICQLSILISRRKPPKGINKVVYFSNPSSFLTEKNNKKSFPEQTGDRLVSDAILHTEDTFHWAVFLQKHHHVCFLHVLSCSNIEITAGFRWRLIYLVKCRTLRRPRCSEMKPSPVVEILNHAARALWRPQNDLNAERRMVAVRPSCSKTRSNFLLLNWFCARSNN